MARNADDRIQAAIRQADALSGARRFAEALAKLDAFGDNGGPEIQMRRGSLLGQLGRPAEALEACDRALAALPPPGLPALHFNRGLALRKLGRVLEAADSYGRALTGTSGDAAVLNNQGNALQAAGFPREAAAAFRRALAVDPDYLNAHTNLIFGLDYDPDQDAASLQAERRRFARRLEARAAAGGTPPHHGNDPDPERPLRVGYLSADFRNHSAVHVFAPVLLGHDRGVIEPVLFATGGAEDAVTARLRAAAAGFHRVGGRDDRTLAAAIRAERIDVLVDLSGYSAGNRLGVFAHKPAPVQVTAWGHVGGTGLTAMDAFLADATIVPAGEEALYAEDIHRLPCMVAYWPPQALPPVAPLPALTAGGAVTFGCFNRMAKVSTDALDLFARCLAAVPASRMIFKDKSFLDPAQRGRILDRLGVAADRVEFLGHTPQPDHLAAFGRIDLALDPIPHGGGVTTLDGLAMGVPAVTIEGRFVNARASAAIQRFLGLEDMIAADAGGYVARAVRWAGALVALAALRTDLRGRLLGSLLCDAAGYARAVEAVYRQLWRGWCAGRGGATLDRRPDN